MPISVLQTKQRSLHLDLLRNGYPLLLKLPPQKKKNNTPVRSCSRSVIMPIQSPQWTEYLSCPVCENGFSLKSRLPISLGCGHTICQTCLAQLRRKLCPFDQVRPDFKITNLKTYWTMQIKNKPSSNTIVY